MKRVLALALVALFAACDAVQQSSGVEEPTPLSGEALRDLAEQGDASAQNNLGNLYYHGEGGPEDYAEAVKWYRKSAEQGYASAQYNLAYLYEQGEGVPQDHAEALKWYRKSAKQGVAGAQFSLGNLYYNGEGVPQDYAEAVKWYRMAAEQGYANAQFNLGVLYDKGEGVPQDYLLAHKWLNLAASRASGQDAENLKKDRELVTEKMTFDQIAEAQRLAREWKAKTWEELKVQAADQ